jgi:transcriptional regulator of acetoin/glycerol metabolism
MAVLMARALPRSRLRPSVPDARRRASPWPGGCECGGGDPMNALAADECWTVSRRLPGPLESMQRDAIVQSLLDYHGSKVKTAGSLGVSRATIYRKIRQYGVPYW